MLLKRLAITGLSLIVACVALSHAQRADRLPAGQKWAATWAASVHGPYPAGNPSAQPDLKFAFPDPAQGAVDQSFRLIVKPDLWGDRFRIRLANTFGTQPVTFDAIFIGVSAGGGNIVRGTNTAGHVRRPAHRHSRSGRFRLQRPRRPQAAIRRGDGWTQARRFVPRRRAERTDDLARQGAADVLSERPSLRHPHEFRRRDAVSVSPRRRGISSMRST